MEEGEVNLEALMAGARDQAEIEKDIGRQADQFLVGQANERDQKRFDKTNEHIKRLRGQVKVRKDSLSRPIGARARARARSEIENLEGQIHGLESELSQIQERVENRHAGKGDEERQDTTKRLAHESRREFLIRTGKITPFSKQGKAPKASENLREVLLEAEEGGEDEGEGDEKEDEVAPAPLSHVNLVKPGFDSETRSPSSNKRRRVESSSPRSDVGKRGLTDESAEDEYDPGMTDAQLAALAEGSDSDEDFKDTPGTKKRKAAKSSSSKKTSDTSTQDLRGADDGNETVYLARLSDWTERRSEARRKAEAQKRGVRVEELSPDPDDGKPEWQKPHPSVESVQLDGDDSEFRIPGDIFPALFDYQKTGVKWLRELYQQSVGGIVGDEMGLGKTIQVISFLAGLHHSGMLNGPCIVVAPATVLSNWANEFHRWWPPLRVSILHSSGSGMLDVGKESRYENELELEEESNGKRPPKGFKAAKGIVDRVKQKGHVLITTYTGLQTYEKLFVETQWQYAVLDEGHKIRNPNAAITVYAKELQTHNRIILSGTPIQNNLTELWSLFDFIYPMLLGTLVTFRTQFETPIKRGGYANASNLEVETAARCAETLKDAISPYLLQRFKVDVAADLPKKTEKVLFCRLTLPQRKEYEKFLTSDQMQRVYSGKLDQLVAIDALRKISNHPDLADYKFLAKKPGYDYGAGNKSGKMQVVKALITQWRKEGHKTLLFSQHRITLDILENYMKKQQVEYRRMDGSTSIKSRQGLINEFNRDPKIEVFLLTTKVGGLGVNLTGADRVIIFDPDWNPSTDTQARERSWRLGQKRDVEIYRLMSAGTIEEKIYHRQIYKSFLSNKILKDPTQKQAFQYHDLHDLFTLGDAETPSTETSRIFQGSDVELMNSSEKNRTEKTFGSVYGISREEAFQAGSDTTKPSSSRAPTSNADAAESSSAANPHDDRILSSILGGSGVHSAMSHDSIMMGSNKKVRPRADPDIITREARRCADEAARHLKEAAEVARTLPAGVPTWTGEVGSAGRPTEEARGLPSRTRDAPASTGLLNELARGQQQQGGDQGLSASGDDSKLNMLKNIRDFITAHGGMVYTQNLVDHFQHMCRNQQTTAQFREMVKKIADLSPGRNGRGRWTLKAEYRDRGRGRSG
ncbi:SNF2 family N-terminal domain-containing protein [Lineolata rhizophorae]|uniref:SNF2 family N-terminal domain-containing protein n=1 Tax=Lineolata rhizophorae TaxID=578093 RepID=A0A6A6P288_9PEZI|nr:SNF2 family N-terminal domain-containing protein [Lineolata rhizophorae]